jgi:F-type H+-transporting ATPase subunit b
VTSRSRRQQGPLLASLAPGLASLLLAGEALAAEGNLVLVPSWQTLLTLLLFFTLLIFPVNALLFRPILRVLDARTEKIAGTRLRAEKLAAEADEVLARYQGSIREVREEAEQDRKARLAEARRESADRSAGARAEAESEIEQARQEIRAGLAEARSQLRPQAEQIAREAAARVLGRSLS